MGHGGRKNVAVAVISPRRLLATELFAIVLLTVPFAPLLGADGLNDTGFAVCYDSGGASISCAAPTAGDDGRYGRDAAAASGVLKKIGTGATGFDFTKIANDGRDLPASAALGSGPSDWACTRDNATGLVWEVKTTGDAHFRSRRQFHTWFNTNALENGGNAGSSGVTGFSSCNGTLPACNTQEYLVRVNSVALCGFRDWRLPEPGELRGIVNYSLGLSGEFIQPFFPPHDPQWPEPHYWTSATYAGDPADAWLVEIGGSADGGGAGHHHPKNEQRLILAVRGRSGPAAAPCNAPNARPNVIPTTPSSDFLDNGNGTVTHQRTGLTWKRCVEGLSGASCAVGSERSLTWADAVAAAESSAFAGFSDWRIPNLKELHSLVETCGHHMAINQSVFPNTPLAGGPVFWTSTPDPAQPDSVFLIEFQYGGAVPARKPSNRLYLRLVRGGDAASAFDTQNPAPPQRRRAVRH